MPSFLTFPGGAKRDPAVEKWLGRDRGELGEIARTWFDVMRRCGDDVRELMHDGAPTVCVQDGGFAYVNAFTAHVNVGFFHGNALPDPAKLLLGDGKSMRHVKLRPGMAIDAPALEALVTAAYRDIHERLRREA